MCSENQWSAVCWKASEEKILEEATVFSSTEAVQRLGAGKQPWGLLLPVDLGEQEQQAVGGKRQTAEGEEARCGTEEVEGRVRRVKSSQRMSWDGG